MNFTGKFFYRTLWPVNFQGKKKTVLFFTPYTAATFDLAFYSSAAFRHTIWNMTQVEVRTRITNH